MREMQFTGTIMMAMLTLTLIYIVLHRKKKGDVLSRSGWMMAIGTALLATQFALQYVTRFRPAGELLKSIMINLLFFIPCVVIMNLGMLNLQRQGRLRRFEWIVGMATWIASAVILFCANMTDGLPLMAETSRLQTAELIAATLFGLMQIFFTFLLIREDFRMKRALANYYDSDMRSMLRWIELSIILLALIGVVAPPFIFNTGRLLVPFSLLIFFGIYYMVLSFVCYSVSNDSQKVSAAEEADRETAAITVAGGSSETQKEELTANLYQKVEEAVAKWMAKGGHLKHELTIQAVADEMGIPRQHLSTWLKATGRESFSAWLSALRIDEAKRMLLAHPEWCNEFVANSCGFSDRSYFQNVFRKLTGLTPAQYAKGGRK